VASSTSSADDALARLKTGHEEFVKLVDEAREIRSFDRLAQANARPPMASVLTCSDSRVAPEIIFNQDLGDIYVVRQAGNVVTMSERASLEFAAAVFKCPLIVVMGHSQCRAVQSAIDAGLGKTFPGDIQELASLIAPAVAHAKETSGDRLENVTLQNVRMSVQQLLRSEVLSSLVDAGTLKIVGAYYSVESGRIRFL